jgi:hypothetical protein
MNTNRVTLTAFGTSGVLLAASLTMLAIVSALVAFDAWPTRDRAASPAEIAVESPHAARVVRTGRRASATTGSRAAGGAGSARGARAERLPGAGGRHGGGAGDPSNPNTDRPSDPAPPPHVGRQPPGEPDPNVPSGGGGSEQAGAPSVVHEVTCGAGKTVGGVNGAAGDAVGSACKPIPVSNPTADSVESGAPAQAAAPGQVDVQVDVPMP